MENNTSNESQIKSDCNDKSNKMKQLQLLKQKMQSRKCGRKNSITVKMEKSKDDDSDDEEQDSDIDIDINMNNNNNDRDKHASRAIESELEFYEKLVVTDEQAQLYDENLLYFWNCKQAQINLPIMRVVTLLILICLTSSCARERMFSDLLAIITDKRSSMSDVHASMVHTCHGALTKR